MTTRLIYSQINSIDALLQLRLRFDYLQDDAIKGKTLWLDLPLDAIEYATAADGSIEFWARREVQFALTAGGRYDTRAALNDLGELDVFLANQIRDTLCHGESMRDCTSLLPKWLPAYIKLNIHASC